MEVRDAENVLTDLGIRTQISTVSAKHLYRDSAFFDFFLPSYNFHSYFTYASEITHSFIVSVFTSQSPLLPSVPAKALEILRNSKIVQAMENAT